MLLCDEFNEIPGFDDKLTDTCTLVIDPPRLYRSMNFLLEFVVLFGLTCLYNPLSFELVLAVLVGIALG